MSIWFQEHKLEDLNSVNKNTISEQIGIKITALGDDYIEGTMPADERTFQPYGLIHGGANIVLAESLGSIACAHVIDVEKEICFGQEVNASHIRPVFSGFVTGVAKPLHIGRGTHIWQIELKNEQDKLSCFVKLTMAIKKRADLNY